MFTVMSENILTMTKSQHCEAFTVNDGIIVFVGSIHEARERFPKAKEYYFGERTVLPSFIDSHGHFLGTAFSFSKLSLQDCNCPEDIAQAVESYERENPSISFIQCSDFNYTMLHTAITESFLSHLSVLPLVISNKSGHAGFFNKKARELLDIDRDNPYLSENEYTAAIKRLPLPGEKEIERLISCADKLNLKNGITVACESCLVDEMFPIFALAKKKKLLNIDIVAHAEIGCYDKAKEYFPESVNGFCDGFRLLGGKIFLDGSIQDKTAWLSEPYVSGELPSGQLGEKELKNAIEFCIERKIQLQAHCNGDMAIEFFLSNVAHCDDEKVKALRFVGIHSQMMSKNQLKKAKSLGVIPSFFLSHVHEYGDVHLMNLGFERASKISPLMYADDMGCPFTIHRDCPVMSPNLLDSVGDAILRKTKSGIVLGKSQRIPVLSALKAITINSAHQHFLENERGSIAVGKSADFVVLSDNIERTSPNEIKSLRVSATFKNGAVLFSESPFD